MKNTLVCLSIRLSVNKKDRPANLLGREPETVEYFQTPLRNKGGVYRIYKVPVKWNNLRRIRMLKAHFSLSSANSIVY
jgi:hypothetical protein